MAVYPIGGENKIATPVVDKKFDQFLARYDMLISSLADKAARLGGLADRVLGAVPEKPLGTETTSVETSLLLTLEAKSNSLNYFINKISSDLERLEEAI